MKTIFSLMLGLVISTAAFAQSNSNPVTPVQQMAVLITDNDKVSILIAEKKATAMVTLMDEGDNVLYSERTSLKHGLQQSMNLSQLPDGVYHLTVSTGQKVIKKTITIQDKPSERTVAIAGNNQNSSL